MPGGFTGRALRRGLQTPHAAHTQLLAVAEVSTGPAVRMILGSSCITRDEDFRLELAVVSVIHSHP